MTSDSDKPVLKDIRDYVAKLTKMADDFVSYVEGKIQEREAELDEKIKEYAQLKNIQKEIDEKRQQLKEERVIINKEKEANRIFKLSLEAKQKKIDEKLAQVQSILKE